jgi:hypothetical protein
MAVAELLRRRAQPRTSHEKEEVVNARNWTKVFLPILVTAAWTGVAHADDTTTTAQPQPVPSNSETVTEKSGPSTGMLFSGALTLGLTYGAGVIVASTSDRDADHRMFVPIAGPWMALFDRGDCGGTTGRSCDTETTYKVLIVADGVGQALGALMMVDAFFNPATKTVSHTSTTKDKPTVHLTPTAMGAGGYGMLAVGSF